MSSQVIETVFIGAGSNLGDRVGFLNQARIKIENLSQVISLDYSSFYQSSPVGFLEQGDFINCVFKVRMEISSTIRGLKLAAQSLLTELQSIEQNLGRTRDPKNQNAPRCIDLDILVFGDLQVEGPQLTVPHPRLHERLFVLTPLLELSPELILPGRGKLQNVLESGHLRGDYRDQEIDVLKE